MTINNLPKVPKGYDPFQDKEDYMNPVQLSFFKDLLEKQRDEILKMIEQKMKEIHEFDTKSGDEGDQVENEVQRLADIRTIDRFGKWLEKIESSLLRIDSGDYGYCKITGEEIGLKRLTARPVADMTIKEQSKREDEESAHEHYEQVEYVLTKDAPEEDE